MSLLGGLGLRAFRGLRVQGLWVLVRGSLRLLLTGAVALLDDIVPQIVA